MSNFIPMLAQIDTRLLIVLAVICVVAFIASVVKKAIKAGILLFILAFVFGVGVPFVTNIQENYGVRYHKENEVIEVKVAGQVTSLNIKELKESQRYEITFIQGTSDTKLDLYYERKDGTAVSERGSNAIKIPNFMSKILQETLKSHGIKYKIEQHNTHVLGNG